MSNKTPPYRIETERLVLRCWEPTDATQLREVVIRSKEHLTPWMPWAANEPLTLDQRIQLTRDVRSKFDRDEEYIYGIFDREGKVILGGTGLHTRQGPAAFEIGYWIATEHTRNGYALETSRALIEVGLQFCEKDRMEIRCDPENMGSMAIPRRLGFTHEVTRRRTDPGFGDGLRRDTAVWTLFQSEYKAPKRGEEAVKAAYDAAGRKIIG